MSRSVKQDYDKMRTLQKANTIMVTLDGENLIEMELTDQEMALIRQGTLKDFSIAEDK